MLRGARKPGFYRSRDRMFAVNGETTFLYREMYFRTSLFAPDFVSVFVGFLISSVE